MPRTKERPVVEFPENVPVTLSLDYPRGKVVSTRFGERVMFSVDQNRVMFLDPEFAGRVENLGLASREPFSMTKTKDGFVVSRLDVPQAKQPEPFGQRPDGTFHVPALQSAPEPSKNGSQITGDSAHSAPARKAPASETSHTAPSLLDEANTLIDTFEAAWQRARQKYDGIKAEEVRALVISAYIQRGGKAA